MQREGKGKGAGGRVKNETKCGKKGRETGEREERNAFERGMKWVLGMRVQRWEERGRKLWKIV